MPLLSIIIPIYNSKKYLRRCINSVLRQKFKDFEIILIDDHSKDKSREICQSFKNNKKFQIHRNSKRIGPGLSRNTGILLSKGTYIIFLDSDDFLYDNCLEGISKLIENKKKDIVITKFNSDKPPFSNNFFFNKKFRNKADLISSINKYHYQTNVCWHYVIKKSFLIKNKIKFTKSKVNEDQEFVMKLLCLMKSFCFFKKNYYWHRARRGSLSKSIDLDTTKSMLLLFVQMSKFLRKKKWSKHLKTFIMLQIKNIVEQFSYRLVLHQKKEEVIKIKNYINKLNLKNYLYGFKNFFLIKKKLMSYKELCSYKNLVIENILKNLSFEVIRNKNLYIFCAHVYGLAMYQILAEKNFKVKYILDDNTRVLKNSINGIKIIVKSPEYILQEKKLNKENYKILVCARTNKTFHNISRKLYILGLSKKNVINKVSYFFKTVKVN